MVKRARLLLLLFFIFGNQGCTVFNRPNQCVNPIPLDRNDRPEIKNLNEWIDGKSGRFQIKKIQFFVDVGNGHETASVESIIPSDIRDPTGKITALSMIQQNLSCNGFSHSKSGIATLSPIFPDVIQRKNGKYLGTLQVVTPYFSQPNSRPNDPNMIYQEKYSGALNRKDLNPSCEKNIFNIFNKNNNLFGHQSKFYRISQTEIELRNFSLPYSNVRRFVSVIYQYKK